MTTKRESEIILIKADFSNRLLDTSVDREHLSSVAVKVYQYGGSSYQYEDFDVSGAGFVIVELTAAAAAVSRKSFPVSGYTVARLALLPTTYDAEADMLTDDSLDESGNATEVREKTVSVRMEGGTAGLDYRIVFTATTNYGNTLIEEQIVSVTSD